MKFTRKTQMIRKFAKGDFYFLYTGQKTPAIPPLDQSAFGKYVQFDYTNNEVLRIWDEKPPFGNVFHCFYRDWTKLP